MADPQNFKNHTRWDPIFHFFTSPILLANVIVAIVVACHAQAAHRALHIWLVVVSVALFVTAGLTREYALKNQNRIIRLEEHLRYHRLLAEGAHERFAALSLKQIVALRFASNAELPELSERAVRENLTPKQIKQSITTWRADNNRV